MPTEMSIRLQKTKEKFLLLVKEKSLIEVTDELLLEYSTMFDSITNDDNFREYLAAATILVKSLRKKPNNLLNHLLSYVEVNNEKRKNGNTHHLYDAEFLTIKFNMPLNYCEEHVKKLKRNKCTDLENFIKRWGKEEGERRFKEFKDNSLWHDKYKDKYGEDALQTKLKESSQYCEEFYTSRGFSKEEASKLVSEAQLLNAGVNRSYYEIRGYSEEEIESIMYEIRKKKGFTKEQYIDRHGEDKWKQRRKHYSFHFNIEILKEKHGDRWKEVYFENKVKAIANGRKYYEKKLGISWEEIKEKFSEDELKNFTRLSLCDRFGADVVNNYYREVQKYTKMSIIEHSDKIKNIHLRGKTFDLDHIFSIKEGLINNVDPEIIGHYTNLQVIYFKENASKSSRCWKTIEKLYEDYLIAKVKDES